MAPHNFSYFQRVRARTQGFAKPAAAGPCLRHPCRSACLYFTILCHLTTYLLDIHVGSGKLSSGPRQGSLCARAPFFLPPRSPFPPSRRTDVRSGWRWNNGRPISTATPAAHGTGMDLELTRAILKEAGCTLTLQQELPPARRQILFEQGGLDLLLAASDTPERRRYARFSAAYRYESVGLFTRPERLAALPKPGSLDAVAEATSRAAGAQARLVRRRLCARHRQAGSRRPAQHLHHLRARPTHVRAPDAPTSSSATATPCATRPASRAWRWCRCRSP